MHAREISSVMLPLLRRTVADLVWMSCFGSDFARKHVTSGLILSCVATTNTGLLTSSVCVQG